jgi:hypothetical protein
LFDYFDYNLFGIKLVNALNRFAGILYRLMRAVERYPTDRRIEPAGRGCANNASLGPTLKRPNCLGLIEHD